MKTRFLLLAQLAGLVVCLLIADVALAQPGGGGPEPGPGNGGGGATDVPLDGGVSLLVAAGVGLGIKRLRRRQAER